MTGGFAAAFTAVGATVAADGVVDDDDDDESTSLIVAHALAAKCRRSARLKALRQTGV